MPNSKSELRGRFLALLDSLVETGRSLGDSLQGNGSRVQQVIDKNEWSGDLTDLAGLASAFSREENSEDLKAAIADVDDPGNVGDLALSSLQGDYLACFERAFRSRTATRVRRTMHAAARRRGHGDDRGVFRRGVQGYLESILKLSKDERS